MKIYVLFFLLLANGLSAQQYGTGLIATNPTKSLKKNRLLGSSYKNLPTSVSLKAYCPPIGNQEKHQTCVAWASAYYTRTILEAIQNNTTNANQIKNLAYSPSWIYELIKKDNSCNQGTDLEQALKEMKEKGTVPLNILPYSCQTTLTNQHHQEAQKHKIRDFAVVFDEKNSSDDKIDETRKSISEKYPVIVAWKVYDSFYEAKHSWSFNKDERKKDEHALVVIAYDDKKFGREGGFLLVNSWGEQWGENGFTWVRYSDFAKTAMYAYEAYPIQKVNERFSVGIDFKMLNGQTVTFLRNRILGGAENDTILPPSSGIETPAHYVSENSFTENTRFQFFCTNTSQMYLYVIASDLTGKVNRIFPKNAYQSPIIGANSSLPFPDEHTAMRLDAQKGKDYFCFLLSKEPLNFDSFLNNIRTEEGNFYTRIKTVLEKDAWQILDVSYDRQGIGINTSISPTGKNIIPILVELDHQ